MSDVDHLLSFPTEADALAALQGTPYASESGWNLGCTCPGLTLYTQVAQYDENGVETQPSVLLNDQYWLLISTRGPGPDPALTALEACRMVADRAAALAGQPFIYQQGLRADPAQIASVVRIDGLPAGSAYPIQNPQVIKDQD